MHADNLVVYQRGHRQAVKTLGEDLPELYVKPPLALVVKPIDSVDGCALVIASEEEEVFWVLDFICQEQTDGLNVVLSAVNIVA